MSLRKKAFGGIKWTSAGTLGKALFQLLQISVLTRFLPKEAFGLVAMALFVIQFSNIFVNMGMGAAILHKQDATENEYSSIYWLNILLSLLFYSFLFISTPFISDFYEEAELNSIIPILGLNIIFMAIGKQHRTILHKHFYFKSIAITELFSYLIGLFLAIYFAINNYGVYSLIYSTLISSLISNILFFVLNISKNPIRFHLRLAETKPFLKIGGYTTGSTIMDFFSRETDILIIGKILGPESLGIYSLSKQIVLKLYAIFNPIVTSVLNPILSSIQKDKNRVKHYYLRVVNLLASINFPIYLMVVLLSKEILTIFYGEQYSSGYLILSFLALSYATNTISNPVGSLQIATGRTDLGFLWTILRVLVTPIVIFFASYQGLNFVAAGIALLSLILTFPLWWIQIRPMGQIKFGEYLIQFIKPYSLFLLISFFFMALSININGSLGLALDTILKGSVGISIFIILLWIFDRKRIIDTKRFILRK